MTNYTILTDSSCNLPDELIAKYELPILSLRYMSDGEEFLSYQPNVPTDLGAFYRMMREGVVFTTSLPYQQPSSDLIEEILASGQDILYIGFSSAISGTYEATEALLVHLAEQYPERTVRFVDTRAAALGEGILVLYAAQMREEGKSLDEVFAWVNENRFKLAHWFTVDDLVYLYRGGRVSRTSATAATLLSIKPVLHINTEGELIPKEKVRGRKKSIQALHQHIHDTFDHSFGHQIVGISHGDCEEDVHTLIDLIRADESLTDIEFVVNELDAVIGAHAGPGTLSVFYIATTRD